MWSVLWAALGVVAGSFLAIQAPINAALSRGLGMPVAAAASSFLAGAVMLWLVSLASAQAGGVTIGWRVPPLWMFIAGGCLGAAFVTVVIILTPRLGAAATMGFVVAGQLLTGILVDRIGFLGLAVREISFGRVAGAILLLAGALLIRLY
ncbi:MAG: DMT family transporter [Rhizobiales bacterium]|nr:DMT family transporter [Hyphomicrobiales bacterium]